MTPPNLSLIFVMVCFWATLWIVYRFLIRPIGSLIDERRRRIDDAEQEWSAKHEEHLSALATVEEKVSAAAKDAARIRAGARQRAMDQRHTTLELARTNADERLAAVLKNLEAEVAAARADLRDRARDLARLLAGRLLGREIA